MSKRFVRFLMAATVLTAGAFNAYAAKPAKYVDPDEAEATGAGFIATPVKKIEGKYYVITDFGVVNDSTVIQTAKIQAVIDRAEAEGGGTIIVPEGTYLTGALFFKPGTKLHISRGGVIKGSDDISNYPLIPSRMEGRSIYYYAAVINAYFVDNFAITGEGTIDGAAYKLWVAFWDRREQARRENRVCTNLEVSRPRLVFLWGCDHVNISGTKFCNSAFWTMHLYQCTDVNITNCSYHAPTKPVKAPSSDAIDIDVCRDVTIKGCYFNVNDDSVCLKGGKGVYSNRSYESGMVENVLVEDCTFGPNNHGVLTLGSECVHATGITVRNCRLETNTALLRLKMRPDTYQIYENVTVENITGTCGTIIDMKPWKQFFDLEGSTEKPFGIVRNILIKDVDVSCRSLGTIAGNPDDQVENVKLENIKIKAETDTFEIAYPAPAVELINVTINGHEVANK